MTKITWLGEDTDDTPGPSFTICFDRKFPKGEEVEVTDKDIIARARKNKFFEVTGVPGRPPKVAATESGDDQDAG